MPAIVPLVRAWPLWLAAPGVGSKLEVEVLALLMEGPGLEDMAAVLASLVDDATGEGSVVPVPRAVL